MDYVPLTFVQVNEFISGVFGFQSLYGLKEETLDSLILDLLPPLGHTYRELGEDSIVDNSQEVPVYLTQEVFNGLRNNAGYHIPRVSAQLHTPPAR